jgi:putative glutamine amidotransferase
MRDGKPILAVCRGAQLLAVAAGGALYQDVTAEYPCAIRHDYFPKAGVHTRQDLVHPVEVVAGTRLSRLIGTDTVVVNSMHHQGIKRLEPSLIANAFSPDGLIEGVESPGEDFVVGVQWHPEDLADSEPRMRSLFDAFIDAASEWRNAAIGDPLEIRRRPSSASS